MASVVLTSVGRAAGNLLLPGFGGLLAGGMGASLGGLVDSQLGLGAHIDGPHLDNLSVQDSRYGAGIPVIYGTARVAGNVIWSTDLMQAAHESSGGKGGATSVTTTTYTYSVHCAVGLCLGPIDSITRIWADTTVIYDSGTWTSGVIDGASFYLGTATQTPDPFMQSIIGSGSVPAYRGLAYVVFENLQLADFGNRLPNLTFEITAAAAAAAPQWQGSVANTLSHKSAALLNCTMMPLTIAGGSSAAQQMLIGGYSLSGSTASFTAALYDVASETPAYISTVNSATFTTATPTNHAWAMAADGRFTACCLFNTAGTHFMAIYDRVGASFGPVLSLSLTTGSTVKQIAWLDAAHFVIDAVSGGVRGVRVFARSGLSVIDLGFTPLWGSGSATSTSVFFGAQFTPFAGGLLAYIWTTPGTSTLTLQARRLSWRNNAVSAGVAYTVVAGLSIGSDSGGHAHFIKTGSAEWTLAYGTVGPLRLLSFEPGSAAATIARPWQSFTWSYGTGTAQAPVLCGNRLVVVQASAYENIYRLTEITLDASSFTRAVDAVAVAGFEQAAQSFAALRLSSSRLLLLACGGSASTFKQIAAVKRGADAALSTIVGDLLSRAGYSGGDYDLSALADTSLAGYIIDTPMSARKAIEPLQAYAPFDLVERDGQLAAVMRGGDAVATIAADDLRAAAEGKAQPPAALVTRAQEMDLPREVSVDYIDPARDYEVNCQRARRTVAAARQVQKLSLPIVCGANAAKRIAETRLYGAWAERDLVKFTLSRAWLALDAGDVVTVGGRALRIAAITQSGGLLQVEAFVSYGPGGVSAATADGGLSTGSTLNAPTDSLLYLMDLPLLRDADDQPGIYVAASAVTGWRGATIMRSADGSSYATAAQATEAALCGIATSALAAAPAYYMDRANSVTVQMLRGELASCTWPDLMNGANAALLGGEIIQFQTATLTDTGLYTLTNLLRGRRGTESATATHALGEDFVLLEDGRVDFLPVTLADRGATYYYRALSSGQSLSDAQDYSLTYALKTLCPLSPVHLRGARAGGAGTDLTITWVRRARRNAAWVDYIDVPLDEDVESYRLDIMNGATVVRSFTGLTAATCTYTAAQQTADWDTAPATVTVKVYQLSARYGAGDAATATL